MATPWAVRMAGLRGPLLSPAVLDDAREEGARIALAAAVEAITCDKSIPRGKNALARHSDTLVRVVAALDVKMILNHHDGKNP